MKRTGLIPSWKGCQGNGLGVEAPFGWVEGKGRGGESPRSGKEPQASASVPDE